MSESVTCSSNFHQQVTTAWRAEQRLPAITTASDEMQVTHAIERFQVAAHRKRLAGNEGGRVTVRTVRL